MHICYCCQADFEPLLRLFKLSLQSLFFSLRENHAILGSQYPKITPGDPDQEILVSDIVNGLSLADLATGNIQLFIVTLRVQGLLKVQPVRFIIYITIGNLCTANRCFIVAPG